MFESRSSFTLITMLELSAREMHIALVHFSVWLWYVCQETQQQHYYFDLQFVLISIHIWQQRKIVVNLKEIE